MLSHLVLQIVWVIGHWKMGEYRRDVWPILLSETRPASDELPCCNFLCFCFFVWFCFVSVRFYAFSWFLFYFFSLESWRCYLSLSQQHSACIFALIFLPGSALWAFSRLFQECLPKYESQLPSGAVSPAAELRLGEVAGNQNLHGSDDAEDAGNWKCDHNLEKHSSRTGKIDEQYCYEIESFQAFSTLFFTQIIFMILYLYQYTDYKN